MHARTHRTHRRDHDARDHDAEPVAPETMMPETMTTEIVTTARDKSPFLLPTYWGYPSPSFVVHQQQHTQEEIDQKSIIRLTWRKLLEACERVTHNLQSVQGKYKKQLIRNVKV